MVPLPVTVKLTVPPKATVALFGDIDGAAGGGGGGCVARDPPPPHPVSSKASKTSRRELGMVAPLTNRSERAE